MEEGDVRFLARVYEKVARMNALLVEVEGMKVANQKRVSEGYPLAYNDTFFTDTADTIYELAMELKEL